MKLTHRLVLENVLIQKVISYNWLRAAKRAKHTTCFTPQFFWLILCFPSPKLQRGHYMSLVAVHLVSVSFPPAWHISIYTCKWSIIISSCIEILYSRRVQLFVLFCFSLLLIRLGIIIWRNTFMVKMLICFHHSVHLRTVSAAVK